MPKKGLAARINIMRASVMGANDGVLSVAGIVVGVAGATANKYAIFLAGIAGMLAGTVSMAMGEYVSVNAQKDSQKRAAIQQKEALAFNYEKEFDYVKQQYLEKGISERLAKQAVRELMGKDALATTVRARFGFNINEMTSPYAAALASMISFPLGSVLPLGVISFFPNQIRVLATFLAVVLTLGVTGYSAAVLGKANWKKGILRNLISGILTMAATYLIGTCIGG
ncbi:VIT1/CCC1 transporter family protein [Liquorilactobacillus oeni]|uniref:Integral membrane protein n=1 Tax=Liquorilactobacillus oeni DSM 19972 TaxID=1423777 RepID=A0A0R1MC01_9LACO|nr:VIT family protein [Liquorilactobacillus oeni]KRL05735.1 hypothetical protein FD46_GL000486 [Liquorilactobacillus oeni DSM 19972]